MKAQKYRPCLTSIHISHILSLCKRDLTEASISIISVLAPFMAKIENSGVAPAYSMKQKTLGNVFSSLDEMADYSCLSAEEIRKKAFEKWSENPDSCSLDELEMVQTYRLENDLMSTEEAKEYELRVFGLG